MIKHGNCLELMKEIPSRSVDLICTDLPFNLTACAWDKSVIDLSAMWAEFKRILKPYSVVALFASGKFAHKLIASNFDWYKYKWIWVKNAPTNFVHAKNAPMHKFEEILIFSDGVINHPTCTTRRMKYNPQGVVPCCELQVNGTQSQVTAYGGKFKKADNFYHCQGDWKRRGTLYIQEQTNYPSDVLEFKTVPTTKRFHPTQKPTDLLEYLIKTYSNAGETVLDATCGSGSTGVACVNTGRKFIGFELDQNFFEIAQKRIAQAQAKKAQELF